jgi:glycosyltransferase involved in cell wall biosynthesis
MKLLIMTQKVDRDDPILGFFHGWIIELSKKFEKVSVICLEKGKFELPPNVTVYSLGKESGRSKIKYIKNFFNLILGLHKEYDSVFVHMNQEYVLLGGVFWKIMRKKVFMWRNHSKGNIFTKTSVWLLDKVFCTSKFAFVAKYKKTSIMPVGINTEMFKSEIRNPKSETYKNKILFLSRISPIKRPNLLIEALGILKEKKHDFVCDFYGDALPKDSEYFYSLKKQVVKLNLENQVKFFGAVPNYETPKVYQNHEIFINLTPSGSFDKTILEAAACGCILVIANKSLSGEIDDDMIVEKETPADIAEKINFWLRAGDEQKEIASKKLQKYVLENHSLDVLVNKLVEAIKK